MNDIINKLLLAGDKRMPGMHLKQPGFTYSASGKFTKNKERIQKHDMVYGDFKGLAKRAAADKVLRDKAFNIAKDLKCDGYQRGLASMVYKFFDKNTAGSGIKSMPQNEQLAEELHKPIIRKFEKIKVYSKTIFGVLT